METPIGVNRNGSGTETNTLRLIRFQSEKATWASLFASKEILPLSPFFQRHWWHLMRVKMRFEIWCTKHTRMHVHRHRHARVHTWGVARGNESVWPPQLESKPNKVGVWTDCFLKSWGVNFQKFANVWKMSPHLNTVSTPFPLVNSCHSPSA